MRARPPGPARQGAGPNARSRAPRPGLTPGPLALRRQARGLSPVQAASDARARLPAPRRSVPQAGLGAELPMRGGPRGRSFASPRPAPPSASARSRRLQTPGRVSPRLGGARLGPGWGPSCPCGVAPSGALSPAPGLRRPRLARPRPRLLLVHTFGAPAPPRVKPWRAPRYCQAAYCDSNEGVRPVGHSQRASPGTAAPTERHLQVTRRPPLVSRPWPVSTRRRTGARIRTPHGRPPARAWLRRRAELAPWPPPEALPPCALRADPTRLPHTICSGTMRACENAGPPPLPFSGGEERPPPLPKWEGRREASSSSSPVFGRGGASGAQAGGPDRGRPRLPGCGSPPSPAAGASSTSAGLSGAPAGAGQWWSPRPPQPARRRPRPARAGRQRVPGCGGPPTPTAGAPSTSAGQSGAPARAGLRWSLNQRGRRAVDLGRPDTLADGGQPGAARAAPVRRGVTAAISNWPAAPAAGQPKQARAPVAGGLAPFSHYF